MAGFDYDAARVVLGAPTIYREEVKFAIGKPARVQDLEEKRRERESPTDTKHCGICLRRGFSECRLERI